MADKRQKNKKTYVDCLNKISRSDFWSKSMMGRGGGGGASSKFDFRDNT